MRDKKGPPEKADAIMAGDKARPVTTGVTTGMVGHGFYNQHSAPQMAAIDYVLPWLDAAIKSMPLAELPVNIGLADFGCSEGRNSIAVMRRAVAALRSRTSRPIQTIHSDLPTNDYTELFATLRPEGRPVFDAADTYSAVVGGSMFDPLLPPRSLHLATSFNAIGFLSRRPVDRLPHYILPNGPSARCGVGSVSTADKNACAAQALADVESFLTARATELVPGGLLLLQVFGCGTGQCTSDGTLDVLNDALLEVLDAGIIDREGYETYYHPCYFRTLDELTAPAAAPDALLAPLFRLERAETYEVAVPFVERFRHDGDVDRYAREFTDFFRAFTEAVLRTSFAEHPHLDRLVTDIYERAERLVRTDPDRYEFHFIGIAALMTRRADPVSAGAPERRSR